MGIVSIELRNAEDLGGGVTGTKVTKSLIESVAKALARSHYGGQNPQGSADDYEAYVYSKWASFRARAEMAISMAEDEKEEVQLELVRVLRVVEYVGPRDQIEEQVRVSIHGEKRFGRGEAIIIRAATIGTFPEILERESADDQETNADS